MSLVQLSDEQRQNLTVEEKDRWWLTTVYQKNVPQLTLRVLVGGFVMGGVLATTNLYVGAKIGVTLGTSITAVVIACLLFNALSRIGLGRRFHVLEGAVLQSIACSAGYMASPLTASIAAFMVVTNTVVPWWQVVLWMLGIAVLGVLFGIPLKRRYINDEQLPFPEGRACGVVLDLLHQQDRPNAQAPAAEPQQSTDRRQLPTRLLLYFAFAAGLLRLLQSRATLEKIRLGALAIPESLDLWYYRLAARFDLWVPSIAGVPIRELTIRPTMDVVVIALGGLMGIRTCVSIMLGAVLNYGILAPWMVHRGDIATHAGADGAISVGFRAITTWSLWCGAAIMTSAALTSFFADRRLLANAVRFIAGRRAEARDDPLRHVEIPRWILLAGLPLAGGAVVWMAHAFFGVAIWLAAVSMPLVFFLTIIAVNATALTSITPHGALGKITQLAGGILAPRNITTNIAAAAISAEVGFQASNFIQNIKPGYMLGAKPRLQAVGHLVGAVSGALASVAVFYAIFLKDNPATLIREDYPFPAVVVWRAVAEALTTGLGSLPTSAAISAIVGAVVGVVLSVLSRMKQGGIPVSAVGLGLAFIIPFDICLAMFAGALFFWALAKRSSPQHSRFIAPLVQHQDAVCSGIVAGAAVTGMLVTALEIY